MACILGLFKMFIHVVRFKTRIMVSTVLSMAMSLLTVTASPPRAAGPTNYNTIGRSFAAANMRSGQRAITSPSSGSIARETLRRDPMYEARGSRRRLQMLASHHSTNAKTSGAQSKLRRTLSSSSRSSLSSSKELSRAATVGLKRFMAAISLSMLFTVTSSFGAIPGSSISSNGVQNHFPNVPFLTIEPANAVLSNPNAGMARSATAALRRAVPVTNDKVGGIQSDLEKAQYLLRFPNRKPWGQMSSIAQQCLAKIELDKEGVMQGVPKEKRDDAIKVLAQVTDALDGMQIALNAQDSDKTATYLSRALKGTSELEILQCPTLPYTIPPAYSKLPKLQGRATLNVKFQGVETPIEIVVDGYSAPLTSGNFLDNVNNGVYKGSKIAIADKTTMFVRPTLKPDNDRGALLPLEVRLKDEFLPDYRQSLDVTNGDYPALPLSIYGAVAMTHGADDTLNAPAEFFIYKFDRASMGGLGGLSFEEGQFSVFGYVSESSHDALEAVKDGGIIDSISIVKGGENLSIPRAPTS